MIRVRRVRRLPIVILVVGLALFVGLAIGTRVLYNQTEDRLLEQRTSEAGAVLEVSISQVRGPLDTAAKLASATDGDPEGFATVLQPYVSETGLFSGAELFRLDEAELIASLGSDSGLSGAGDAMVDEMLATAQTEPFIIVDLLDGNRRRLGYAVVDSVESPQFLVYGERTLSDDPNIRRRTEAPFAQLDYAIYLGSEESGDHLLGSSSADLPFDGRRSSVTLEFGNTELLLVMTPIGHLSGDLFANLWWIVGALGVVFSCSFAILVKRLLDRRDTALELATDNERLYDEQRLIAETLQLSLLPEHLDRPPGTDVAARYWPAGAANLIGGDFYDVFQVDDRRWGVTIGDVCGKGIEAAALTGLARHTVRAAARHMTSAADVLGSVHTALSDHRPATFCTACFLYLTVNDDDSYGVEVSLGGHPQPLLRRSDGTIEFVGAAGTLLGMVEPVLTNSSCRVDAGDVLVLYTDGLTDAPIEQAVPIEEVKQLLADDGDQPVEQLADSIRSLKRRRRPRGSGDDTALLVIRFGVGRLVEPAVVSVTGREFSATTDG